MHKRNAFEKYQQQMTTSDKIATKITNFSGSLRFVYIHLVWWTGWFALNSALLHVNFDKYPYGLLTMILSLEAILLSTFIMIGQNLSSARDKVQAEHQYKHQEKELKLQTKILYEQNKILEELQKKK